MASCKGLGHVTAFPIWMAPGSPWSVSAFSVNLEQSRLSQHFNLIYFFYKVIQHPFTTPHAAIRQQGSNISETETQLSLIKSRQTLIASLPPNKMQCPDMPWGVGERITEERECGFAHL